MNRLSNVLIISLGVFLINCSDDSQQSLTNSDDFFESKPIHSLKAQKTNANRGKIGNIMMMYFIGDNLVLGDLPTEYLYKVYDSTLTTFFEICKVGEGPNEFKFPTFLQSNGKDGNLFVTAYNPGKLKYVELDWAKTLSEKSVAITNPSLFSVDPMVQRSIYLKNINSLVSVGLFPTRFRVYNNVGSIVNEQGEYPFRKDFSKVSFENLAMAFQGHFTIDTEGYRLAFATTNSTNLDFLSVKVQKVSILKTHHITKPDFKESKQEVSAAITTKNKMGILDIQSDDKFVYALYSGKDLENGLTKAFESDIIYVFNWSGDLICKLKLDTMISKFTIKKSESKIFAFVNTPSPEIVTFTIPNI